MKYSHGILSYGWHSNTLRVTQAYPYAALTANYDNNARET